MRSLIYGAMVVLLGAAVAGDMTPSPELRKNRNTYHPVVDVLRPQRTPVTDEQLKELD